MSLADAHRRAGRLQEAFTSLEAAYQRRPAVHTACDLGMLGSYIGRLPDAARYLVKCTAAALAPGAPDEENRARIVHTAELENVRRRVAALAIDAPRGMELRLNAHRIGRAPIDEVLFVEPGRYTVSAEQNDRRAEETIAVAPGEAARVTLTPAPTRPTAPPTPPAPPPPPAPPDWRAVAFPTALALSGTAAAGGIVTFVASRSFRSDAAAQLTEIRAANTMNACAVPHRAAQCQRMAETYNTGSALQDWTLGLGIAAVAAGATAAAIRLTTPRTNIKVSAGPLALQVEARW